jgi:diguanylate cyclase (GGDEF)-like protein/PAS domain S-box-containing protein
VSSSKPQQNESLDAPLRGPSGQITQPANEVLVVESSATRLHVLRRVLASRYPVLRPCRSPEETLQQLRAAVRSDTAPTALLISLDPVPARGTDELLYLLQGPVWQSTPVLLLVHAADTALVDWAARRARTAILLWEDFTDSALCLDKLLAPAGQETPAATTPFEEPVRVLLVDDSRTVRTSFARLLADQGYIVDVAAHAAEAWEKLQSSSFDIAIIDYFMPGENGDVLCRRLRDDPRTRGIIAAIHTGTYHEQVIQDSLQAGAVECMFKNEAQELFLARLAAMARMARAQKSIEAERHRLSSILTSVGDGVYGVNRDGVVTFMNPACRSILGFGDRIFTATDYAHALFHHSREDGVAVLREACRLQQLYATGSELHAWNTVFWRQDGQPVPVECTVYPLRVEGCLEGSVVAFRDVSERRVFEQKLFWQANHDPLTRLPNRRHFEAQLEMEVECCRRGGTSALLYIDLDRFKYINDIAGHAAGDRLLVEISQRLGERLRETDMLARLGGDEFAIILRQVNEAQARRVAETFREVLEEYTFMYEGQPYRIYGSVGVAMIDAETVNAGDVLANADIACHVAKAQGRNQTHVYHRDGDDKQAMNLDLGWSSRLQQALRTNRFVLHFQPIVPLTGLDVGRLPAHGEAFSRSCGGGMAENGVLHCETLIRLLDDNNQIISPGAFLPTAERFGLMPHIDLWVLRQAIEHLAVLQAGGLRSCISVNISGQTLDHDSLVPEIVQLLDRHAVDPRALIFEITETNAIANIDAAKRLINELRERGCRFALDDFGSGFSSFHHLKHLPVDFVKIDGQFVRDMLRDPADRAIVQSINDIAHSLGRRTVAEFVENREILQMLKDCGVDYAQGYYVSPPREQVPGTH